jgi:xylose isomerase
VVEHKHRIDFKGTILAELKQRLRRERYQVWESELGRAIDQGEFSLAALADFAADHGLNPTLCSGRQELAESIVARHCRY